MHTLIFANPVLFLSTLSLRRATHYDNYNLHCVEISIHALLAESDLNCSRKGFAMRYFYPRSPCGERLSCAFVLAMHTPGFLSTLSLRRATAAAPAGAGSRKDFYPRSPCGERPTAKANAAQEAAFLSTLSLRRATSKTYATKTSVEISIHALLAESDASFAGLCKTNFPFLSTLSLRRATLRGCPASSPRPYFYPRSPCGERQKPCCPAGPGMPFLSTLSLRRATACALCRLIVIEISIHALLAESDRKHTGTGPEIRKISIHALLAESDRLMKERTINWHQFLSTLSLRRATKELALAAKNAVFLSTLSLRRATRHNTQDAAPICISIHALLAESDPAVTSGAVPLTRFLSTLSLRRATPHDSVTLIPHQFLSTLSLRRATTATLLQPFRRC